MKINPINVFCSGELCQNVPENAKHIVIDDDEDERLTMQGYYYCPQCRALIKK